MRMKSKIVFIIALSALALLVVCLAAVSTLIKCRKVRKPFSTEGPAFTPSINKKAGIGSTLSSSVASSTSMSLLSSMQVRALSIRAFSLTELEKALSNEYFKQKKFNEAIDCYSRSITFLPPAVAYANRAMAYLKIKRFQEAEGNCTEALNLDDRYVKAYSRRATARKELGKLKESMDDADFVLRLEPDNVEIKKQFAEFHSVSFLFNLEDKVDLKERAMLRTFNYFLFSFSPWFVWFVALENPIPRSCISQFPIPVIRPFPHRRNLQYPGEVLGLHDLLGQCEISSRLEDEDGKRMRTEKIDEDRVKKGTRTSSPEFSFLFNFL